VAPLYPQKLALTLPTSGGRSVGIIRSRIKATEFSSVFIIHSSVLHTIFRCAESSTAWPFYLIEIRCITTSRLSRISIRILHLTSSGGGGDRSIFKTLKVITLLQYLGQNCLEDTSTNRKGVWPFECVPASVYWSHLYTIPYVYGT
jgi:hypothetical protein